MKILSLFLYLFLFINIASFGQTKIGAGGGFMTIKFEDLNQISQNVGRISISKENYDVPSLNCFAESKFGNRVSGLAKISYAKFREQFINTAPIEFFNPPEMEFSLISTDFLLNMHVIQRDKKKHSLHQINFGIGGGFHRFFNFVDKSEFITTDDSINEMNSSELSLSWEVSFDIKNFRFSIMQSKGKLPWFDTGVIGKSNFYSFTGNYLFQL